MVAGRKQDKGAGVNVDIIQLKQKAAERAVEFVESGTVVGLGHGSTAIFAVRRIAQLLRDGQLQDILGVPCSRQVEGEAQRLGIPLTTLDEHPVVDLTIDGADEVDPHLNVIKGGGGALLREKIVAQASRREIIVVDESKLSPALGTRWSVPVEVVPFGWRSQVAYLESLGTEPVLRRNSDGTPFKTDQGNLILDCHFGPISQPARLAARMSERAGIVEHGLFLGLVTDVIVAGVEGIRHLKSSALSSVLSRAYPEPFDDSAQDKLRRRVEGLSREGEHNDRD
jgi:ribose 5-phosphate isomerase A